MKKKENAKNSKRNNIMQAAVEIFAARGFHKATIAEIAQKANVSTGLIYSNFENKQDILLSIVVNCCKRKLLIRKKRLFINCGLF
jgi:AcrR family transcriptional regulator